MTCADIGGTFALIAVALVGMVYRFILSAEDSHDCEQRDPSKMITTALVAGSLFILLAKAIL